MVNISTLLRLRELEDKIKVFRILSKAPTDDKYFTEEYKEAAKADVKLSEYEYKRELADMSAEDKVNLFQLSLNTNVRLKFLFELSPTDEEKESIIDAKKWFNEPWPWQDELMEFIEKEEKKRK